MKKRDEKEGKLVFYRPYFWNSQSRLSFQKKEIKLWGQIKMKNDKNEMKKKKNLLPRGQTCLVLSQREMQWKWNAWSFSRGNNIIRFFFLKMEWKSLLQTPQATVQSSFVADAWFAWHSMPERKKGRKKGGVKRNNETKKIKGIKWNQSKELKAYTNPWCDSCRLHSYLPRYLRGKKCVKSV